VVIGGFQHIRDHPTLVGHTQALGLAACFDVGDSHRLVRDCQRRMNQRFSPRGSQGEDAALSFCDFAPALLYRGQLERLLMECAYE